MIPLHLRLACLYELRPGERCEGCKGEIHPTAFGAFTRFILDTRTNKPYHGDCALKLDSHAQV